MRFPAWYDILVGILMITLWTFSILTSDISEFQTVPWELSARDTLHSRVNEIVVAMNTARSANPARILLIAVALALITAPSDISWH
jgi:hypothetical protein